MFGSVYRVLTATAVLAVSSGLAFAAEIIYPPPPPPEVEMRPTIQDWSGPYAGVAVGVASMNTLYVPSAGNDPELSGDSVTIAGIAGYNMQFDNVVFGVEGDITLLNLTTKNRLDQVELEIPYVATARLRLGYALDSTLVYMTGGIGMLTGKMTLPAFNETDKKTHYGYVVGAGMETELWDDVNLRLEYLYGDFGKKTYTFVPGNVNTGVDSLHLVRAGLIYNFDPNG